MKLLRDVQTIEIALDPQDAQNYVDMDEKLVCGIELPSGWDAADIEFLVANSTEQIEGLAGGSDYTAAINALAFKPLFDDVGQVTITTAAANRVIQLDPALFTGFRFLRIRSSAAQSADRDVVVVTRQGR